ncbi:MAG: hypothetical protein Q4F84_07900 [Fibrobacter sp.]|nr:hypothetical protein [Fibrobacter sp.]
MDNVWEKVKKGFKDGAALSMEKIEEFTKVGKLKVEEMAAKRKIERNFVDMGERTFDLIEEGKKDAIGDDLTVKKGVENIIALREELVAIEKKIKEVQEEYKKEKDEQSNSESETTGY